MARGGGRGMGVSKGTLRGSGGGERSMSKPGNAPTTKSMGGGGKGTTMSVPKPSPKGGGGPSGG